ncbi:hypothetical protein Tco_0426750, partial [Tanacetum coccineum]
GEVLHRIQVVNNEVLIKVVMDVVNEVVIDVVVMDELVIVEMVME